jgi:hypothetical protein
MLSGRQLRVAAKQNVPCKKIRAAIMNVEKAPGTDQ